MQTAKEADKQARKLWWEKAGSKYKEEWTWHCSEMGGSRAGSGERPPGAHGKRENEHGQPLGTKTSPRKEMGTSVLPPLGTDFSDDLNELACRCLPRAPGRSTALLTPWQDPGETRANL